MNTVARRIAAAAAMAVAPAVLAVGLATASHASTVVPNPGPQIFAGQHDVGGVNGKGITPGSREHHHHQKHKNK
ncbi:MAG: hypothetical protein QOE04_4213 [Mycobacterium sp.]|jgi:hypothetical protein|nr:hypothetical protein [Mycobacterium sp.]MDT5390572.1 hypothetical protein [Mycobacterium sp.]MDT5401151.1 hypothetical protein [Mycobacterium sp.]